MKIFMTVLMASIAWSSADVSHLQPFNYHAQQPILAQQQQPLISQIVRAPLSQEIHTQGQYQQQPLRPLPVFQPNQQYITSLPQRSQSYQQQYSQPLVPQYEQQQFNSQQQYSSQLSQPLLQPQAHPQAQPQAQPLIQPESQHQETGSLPLPQARLKKPSRKLSSSIALPMPDGLTVVEPPQFKTGRRYRPRVRVQFVTKKPIISKSFFIHTAPEETEEDEEISQITQQPHKHYNVLFVKTPSQTNKATALNFAKSLNEERTVVYVLSKKTTAADLNEALIDQPPILRKPEVFFIKYHTPEEAAHAQRQIQAQYDSLGGSTTISDEGVAPVTSVVGSLDEDSEDEDEAEVQNNQQEAEELEQQQPEDQQAQLQQQQQQVADQSQYNQASANNQYLPPNHARF